jgi:hypothetical protein
LKSFIMLWVTAFAVVWVALVVTVIAMCRAAALGDAAQRVRDVDRLGRFSRAPTAISRRRRSHIG